MTEIVTAVYEKGILRPLQPLKLRERQTVRIQILRDAIPLDPLSTQERQALADRLGSAPGKTASEMVIEDRGE